MSAETKARAASPGGWGRLGSAKDGPRYALRDSKRRRRICPFCRTNRCTHIGMANGVALCGGCELCIARWVEGGYEAFRHLDEPCRACPDSGRYHNETGCTILGCTCPAFVGPHNDQAPAAVVGLHNGS